MQQPKFVRSFAALLWLCAGVLSGVGCASGDETPGDKAPATRSDTTVTAAERAQVNYTKDGCDAIDLAPPAAGEGIQVAVDLQLMPGQERQVCKLVLAGQNVNLNWSDGVFTKGSHHGTTSKTSYRDALPTQNIRGETVDSSQAADCESVGSDWEVQAVIAGGRGVGESPNTALNGKGMLPDDVALKIAANEVLELNFHMFNATDKPVHACYKQNLHSIPDAQVKFEAGTMFYYNAFITVPANSKASATMACPITADVTLAGQVSHMHKRGVGYRATLLDGDPLAGGRAMQTLYSGIDWLEPVVLADTPALALSKGQWIKWSCDYENPDNRNVAQGQQTTDEMCMFIGVYWPRSPAMDWCMPEGTTDTTKGYGAARLLATGTKNGSEFLDCWNNSPKMVGGGGPDTNAERYATQSCFTETCANVSGHVNDFGSGALDPGSVGCD